MQYIEKVDATSSYYGPGAGSFVERVGDYIQYHDDKLTEKLNGNLNGKSMHGAYKAEMLEHLNKLESQFLDPQSRQFFEFVRAEAISTADANDAYLKKKIRSKVESSILELQSKAINKLNQGFEKLISSQ